MLCFMLSQLSVETKKQLPISSNSLFCKTLWNFITIFGGTLVHGSWFTFNFHLPFPKKLSRLDVNKSHAVNDIPVNSSFINLLQDNLQHGWGNLNFLHLVKVQMLRTRNSCSYICTSKNPGHIYIYILSNCSPLTFFKVVSIFPRSLGKLQIIFTWHHLRRNP